MHHSDTRMMDYDTIHCRHKWIPRGVGFRRTEDGKMRYQQPFVVCEIQLP